MVRLRMAEPGRPTFAFFLHAGGSPLSVGRLAAALPASVGVLAADLPRGGGGAIPPRRAADAADGAVDGLLALYPAIDLPKRLVLVGNSYGALLAYEAAWRLAAAGVAIERLVVSGFRAPVLAPAEAALHRLPSDRLWAELAARFGALPGEDPSWRGAVEEALRADLAACDTYRHAHAGRLAVPVDVLRMADDRSVSEDELAAWHAVSDAPVRLIPQDGGHFPWTTHPVAVAHTLLQLAERGHG